MGSRTRFALMVALMVAGAVSWTASSHLRLERAATAQPRDTPVLQTPVLVPPPAPPGSMEAAPPPPPQPPAVTPPPPPTAQVPAPAPMGLPQGLAFPSANFGPDGGPRFPTDSRGIAGAIDQAMPQMRECYAEWLKLDPQVAGRLELGMRLASDGGADATVERVHVLGDAGTGNRAFEGCVRASVAGLQFEAPVGGSMSVELNVDFRTDAGH